MLWKISIEEHQNSFPRRQLLQWSFSEQTASNRHETHFTWVISIQSPFCMHHCDWFIYLPLNSFPNKANAEFSASDLFTLVKLNQKNVNIDSPSIESIDWKCNLNLFHCDFGWINQQNIFECLNRQRSHRFFLSLSFSFASSHRLKFAEKNLLFIRSIRISFFCCKIESLAGKKNLVLAFKHVSSVVWYPRIFHLFFYFPSPSMVALFFHEYFHELYSNKST